MNFDTGKTLTPYINKQGYLTIRYGGRKDFQRQTVHRLVAKAFVLNPHNYNIVNHIDGNKLNNHADNLEWVSHNENMRHVARNGLIKKQRCKKLSSDQVFDIRELALYGFGVVEIAKSFCVHENTVRKIINCENWRHEEMPERKVA